VRVFTELHDVKHVKVADSSETSVCKYQTVLHTHGGTRFSRKVDVFLLNDTMSYTGRQQSFPKRRYVHIKLHYFIYTQMQQVPPQRLTLSTELHRLTWRLTVCPLEMALTFYQIAQRFALAGINSHSHGRENLKYRTVYKIFSKMSLNSSEIIRACIFYIYFAEWISSFNMKVIKRIVEEVSCLHIIKYVLCWKL